MIQIRFDGCDLSPHAGTPCLSDTLTVLADDASLRWNVTVQQWTATAASGTGCAGGGREAREVIRSV